MAVYSIETYGELRSHLQQEWLITNGIGGFASGTVVGCNTRRYHGLLCAALLPPVGRCLMLNRLGEILRVQDQRSFAGTVHLPIRRQVPSARRPLSSPVRYGNRLARWEYEVEGIRVVKEIQMPWDKNAVGIRYTIDPGDRQVELSLLPFVRMMDFHALRHEKADIRGITRPTHLFTQAGLEQTIHHRRRRLFSAAAGLVVRPHLRD